MTGRLVAALVWVALACAVALPVAIAAASPLLAARGPAYVAGGMAGVVALAFLLAQPLLASGYLPGVRATQARRWHGWLGSALVAAVALHVGGLYLASPPDMMDALLLRAPTPFSVWGVIGLWAVALTAVLVAVRTRIGLAPASWRIAHNALAAVVVLASVVHALMIEGAMGGLSKTALCVGVLAATAVVMIHLRVVRPIRLRRVAPAGASRRG